MLPHAIASNCFDLIPDDLILFIFNRTSDVKTLTSCKSVSKRFNSLAPLTENLFLKVDSVVPPDTDSFGYFFQTIYNSLQSLISPKRKPFDTGSPWRSPFQILGWFQNIKRLEIELPGGDLRLEKGVVVRWRAEFGKSLKSCVILAVQGDGDQVTESDQGDGELKLRVVWTIRSLVAASTRHYMLRKVIAEHKDIQNLILRDKDGEGSLVMDGEGLKEFRESGEDGDGETNVSRVERKNRTIVPAVRMRMRHISGLVLSSGVQIKGAALVMIRATNIDSQEKMVELGVGGDMFEGVYFGEVVGALMKQRSYLLEMNSF